jgi:katanin p60 ATPase-containing subunit A1
MLQLLEKFKVDITKSRSLAYFGKYPEAISEFNKVIDKIKNETDNNIYDKILLAEWSKLGDEIKHERDMAIYMKEILQGNFEHQPNKHNNSQPKEYQEKEIPKNRNNYSNCEENLEPKFNP